MKEFFINFDLGGGAIAIMAIIFELGQRNKERNKKHHIKLNDAYQRGYDEATDYYSHGGSFK